MADDLNIAEACSLIRDAAPGSIVMVAPDVYARLPALVRKTTQPGPHDAISISGPKPSPQTQVRCDPMMDSGKVVVVSPPYVPAPNWAHKFLSKGGPNPHQNGVVHDVHIPPPPPPPPEPEPPWRPPGPRQRVVDT